MALKKHQLRKLRKAGTAAPDAITAPTTPALRQEGHNFSPGPWPGVTRTPRSKSRVSGDIKTEPYTYTPSPNHAPLFADPAAFIQRFLPHREGTRLAIAAPRGAAKPTIHSLLFPIMDLLSGRERHQVIISGTMAQSKNRIQTITNELRTNPHIRAVFFNGKAPRFKSTTRTIELGNCRIEAFSAGSEMRGFSHGECRSTRIILDDVEQSRSAFHSQADHKN